MEADFGAEMNEYLPLRDVVFNASGSQRSRLKSSKRLRKSLTGR